ncbi:MAG: restriction endonuclease [Dehalococcoidia bacterium]|nr:restriction endonuclease [Dehalococcoidia bacterium]
MVTAKRVAPAAVNALKEALTNIYWYKSDLRSFIMNTINDTNILAKLDWNDYKRNIVTLLINYLARNQDLYQNDLLRLMSEAIKIEDFSHLSRLEDGADKVSKARESVNALRTLVRDHFDLVEEQRISEGQRKVAYENMLRNQGVRDRLREIEKDFLVLISNTNPQQRGFALERVLGELFTLFDLDPKASFRITGEQIDGAFTFDNTDYILEAKWQQEPVGTQELDTLHSKLTRMTTDITLGLFLSINGYSDDAVKAHSSGRRLMILMDGSHLMAVIEGRIDLMQLLLRMRRHASQTGNIYLRIHDIMLGEK